MTIDVGSTTSTRNTTSQSLARSSRGLSIINAQLTSINRRNDSSRQSIPIRCPRISIPTGSLNLVVLYSMSSLSIVHRKKAALWSVAVHPTNRSAANQALGRFHVAAHQSAGVSGPLPVTRLGKQMTRWPPVMWLVRGTVRRPATMARPTTGRTAARDRRLHLERHDQGSDVSGFLRELPA